MNSYSTPMTHLDAYTGAGDGQTCPTEANGAFLRAAQQRPRSAAWPLTKKGLSQAKGLQQGKSAPSETMCVVPLPPDDGHKQSGSPDWHTRWMS
jgi:hypothetical protein